jgi:hypothetical protein
MAAAITPRHRKVTLTPADESFELAAAVPKSTWSILSIYRPDRTPHECENENPTSLAFHPTTGELYAVTESLPGDLPRVE